MDVHIPKSSVLLENLMNNLTDVIYFKDLESRFIKVNKACADKHGWETVTLVKGLSDFDVFSDAHARQAYEDEQRIIETGEPLIGIEEKETWPDGRVTWVSTSKMPLRNADGEIIGTFGIGRDITQHKETELRAHQAAEEIRLITEEMEEDIRMAGDLQKTFFTSSYPSFPGKAEPEASCVEFLHAFRSSGDVGSDYCSIRRVSDTQAGIFVCDVGGNGVRSALGTALIRGIVQEISPLVLDPGAYLTRMNELLVPLIYEDDALLDVTACYLLLDVVSGEIRYASAGHPPPILFRRQEGARWLCADQKICGPRFPDKNGTKYTSFETRIDAGDAVVIYTDGLYSTRNRLDDPYGLKRLLDSAQSFAGDPLADIFSGLEQDALAFSKNSAFTDDVCLAGFHLRHLIQQNPA